MDWLGAEIDGPLVVVRAVHLAATAVTTGTLIFRAVLAEVGPGSATPAALIVGKQTLRVAWVCLAISAASGIIWVLLQAASMSGLPFAEAMTSDVLLTVLNETHRSDRIARYEQEFALVRNDARVGRGEHADGERCQLVNSCGDGSHMPVEAAGYGGV